MFGGNSPSLADIAAVTDNKGNNGFGDGNGWWALIILFALFGWGGNGFGNRGGSGCGETTIVTVPTGGYGMSGGFSEAAIQRGFDNQAVINKLNGLENGICGLGYDQLAQMNGINANVMQTGYGIVQAVNNSAVASMQTANDLSRQLADCCCENRAAIAQVRYDMATNACAINTNVHQTGDAIIQNQNQNFQMLNNTIRDGFCTLEMREMQRENQNLRDKVNACDRNNALQSMSSYIVEKLNPQAKPSFVVPNPNYNGPIPVIVQPTGECRTDCRQAVGF